MAFETEGYRSVDEIIGKLRALLVAPGVSPLPWRYGDGKIEPRISKEWPIENKTLARAAVNALPALLAEIDRLRIEALRK